MRLRRVVITGMGAISPFGRGVPALMEALLAGRSGVASHPELAAVGGLRTRVAALVPELDHREIERHHRRSMSPMSIFATLAAREACRQGGVTAELAASGKLGVAIGSTVSSTRVMEDFFRDYFTDNSLERMKSTFFFQIMNHTCAANVAQALGITGRVVAPAAACSTGCQAVGLAVESIRLGRQEMVLAGGADEFHALTAATFDVMNAASLRYNDEPTLTPRPFDRDRDGVVCAEGAGVLLLESLDSARERGATVLGEVLGFASLTDTGSIANPSSAAIETCMRAALEDARIDASRVEYVNAHATATEHGDQAEGTAIARVIGARVPVSSLKGHLGHTMAASGAIELIATVEMLARGVLVPTRNLHFPDPACGSIFHLPAKTALTARTVLKNNFALGGVNSSLVIGSVEP